VGDAAKENRYMKKIFEKAWPLLVILGLWFVFSFPYFSKGLVPFPSTYLATFFPPWSSEYGMPVKNNAMPDVITQIYPWKKLTVDTWKSGAVPLWNPYSFSGTAHAGNYQSAVFFPINLLFFVLPFMDAWSIMILLQPLLAGIFMYFFVRSVDRSKEASLLAAIAFMFSGFMVVWMAYGTLSYAALFLPLIFWGVRKKYGWAVSAGIALSLLSGHFQVSIYVIGAAIAYIFWKKEWRTLWFVLFGLLIAAPQILLGIRSFTLSTRGAAVVKGEVIPWQYLLTFIAPDFFGNPVTRNDWFGHYAEWAGFIGVAPLLLAISSIIGNKSKEIWFFILLLSISLLLALPTPINNLLYVLKIPVLSGSAASRIIILVSFACSVLAAFGLDGLKEKINIMRASILGICIVGITWIILLIGKPFDADKLNIATHNFILPSVFVILVSVACILKKKFVLYILIGLTALDLLRFATKWMPFEPRQFVYPEVKSLTFLQASVGNDRAFGNIGSGEVGTGFRIPLVEGYDAVYQARYGEFISAASDGTVKPINRSVVLLDKGGRYSENILELLGVRYILHRKSDGRNVWTYPFWKYPSYREIYSDEAYEVWENQRALPRVLLASSYAVETDKQKILDRLFSPGFTPRDSLVLEEKPLTEPQSGTGSAEIVLYTPNKVTIKTNSQTPKLLFLSDVYDTGWQVSIDGQSSLILRADYDFRAVSLTSGKHTVIFTYAPKRLWWDIIGRWKRI
jgi:hypothetical protein